MSDLRKAAQQALEALLDHGGAYLGHEDKYYAAITALEQALAEFEHQSKSQTDTKVNLAEPEQEPVAWWNGRETVWLEHELMGTNPPIENAIPLYTAPTPRKPVELTDEQCDAIYLALDCWARELDYHEFGLPVLAGGGVGGGRAIIRKAAHGIKEQEP